MGWFVFGVGNYKDGFVIHPIQGLNYIVRSGSRMRFSVIVHDNLVSEWDEGQYPLLKVRDHGNKNHYVCKKREEITEGSPSDHQTPPQIRTLHQRQTANRTQDVHPRSQPTHDFVSKPLKYKKSRLKHTLKHFCKQCANVKREKKKYAAPQLPRVANILLSSQY